MAILWGGIGANLYLDLERGSKLEYTRLRKDTLDKQIKYTYIPF